MLTRSFWPTMAAAIDSGDLRRDRCFVDGEGADIPAVSTFVDERGNGLRVSWHEDQALAVLSIWRGAECVGTVRLGGNELMRLSTLITQAWIGSLRQPAPET
jgi:hypothetical protein